MVLFNYSTRELTAKIVYYGPGLCGKTTNLQFIYKTLPGNIKRGKMLSLATKTDRTLFFDFLPIDLGRIRGLRTRIQLYTVPGQVFYNSTRKLVLKGADGIVFVADSQKRMAETNKESFQNLEDNLAELGMVLKELPLVLQFNKRDLSDLSPVEEMNSALNRYNAPFYESVATTGIGVEDTLKAVIKLVLGHLSEKYSLEKESARKRPAAAAPAPQPAAAPVQPAETTQEPETAAEIDRMEVTAEEAPEAVTAPEPARAAAPDSEPDETILDLDAPTPAMPGVIPSRPDGPGAAAPAPVPDTAMTQAIPILQNTGADPDEEVLDLDETEILPAANAQPEPQPPAAAPSAAPEMFSELGEGEIDTALDGFLAEQAGEMAGAGLDEEQVPDASPLPGTATPATKAPEQVIAPVAVRLALQNGGEVTIPLEVQLQDRTVRYRLRMSLEVLADNPAAGN